MRIINDYNLFSLKLILYSILIVGLTLLLLGLSQSNYTTMANGIYTVGAALISYYFLKRNIATYYVFLFLIFSSFIAFSFTPMLFGVNNPVQLFTYYLLHVGGYILVSFLLYQKNYSILRWLAIVIFGLGVYIYDRILLFELPESAITLFFEENYFYIKFVQMLHYVGMVGVMLIVQHNKQKIESKLSLYIDKIISYNDSIIQTSKNRLIYSGDLTSSMTEIVQAASSVIPCARISIWEISDDQKSLQLKVGYDSVKQSFFHHPNIDLDVIPSYRNALLKEEIIAAPYAREDSRTQELNEGYLIPLGIKSLMDTPIFVDEKLKGVVCFEEYRHEYEWESIEQMFSLSMGKLISISYYCAARDIAFEEIYRHNSQLESVNMNLKNIYGDLEEKLNLQTSTLEEIKFQLTDISFKNNHHVRGPLSRIQGLLNLYKMDTNIESREQYIEYMVQCTLELDNILKDINRVIKSN
jgi:hypothetical protein